MDAKTIATTAASAVGLLAAAAAQLPAGAASEIGKSLGSAAAQKIKQMYEAIVEQFRSKPAALDALHDLTASPDDADAQACVRIHLRKILATDAEFARTLVGLLEEIEVADGASTFHTTIHGDVHQVSNIGTVFGDVSF